MYKCIVLRFKPAFLSFVLLVCWSMDAASQVDVTRTEPSASSSEKSNLLNPPRSNSVTPGPLENERIALLTAIHDAGRKGIGIHAYLVEFMALDQMVGNGESREGIQKRLSSLNSALNDQLSMLQHKLAFCHRHNAVSRTMQQPPMSLSMARLYMVKLVNADRAKYSLAPLTLDAIASAAG
jgi:hypothetical protein